VEFEEEWNLRSPQQSDAISWSLKNFGRRFRKILVIGGREEGECEEGEEEGEGGSEIAIRRGSDKEGDSEEGKRKNTPVFQFHFHHSPFPFITLPSLSLLSSFPFLTLPSNSPAFPSSPFQLSRFPFLSSQSPF